jgi:hypothetical protein
MTHSTKALVLHPAGLIETVTLTLHDIAELGDIFGTGRVDYPLSDGTRLALAEDHEEPSAGLRNHLAAAVLYAGSGRRRDVYGSALLYSVDRRGAVVDLAEKGRHLVRVVERTLTA